jgi:hypothetical protein
MCQSEREDYKLIGTILGNLNQFRAVPKSSRSTELQVHGMASTYVYSYFC